MDTSQRFIINGTNLEYRWIGPPPGGSPTFLFLHEGLGCVSLWRDFPARLAERTGLSALVYSRAGYGGSDPVSLPRPVRFMHDEAETLATLLEQLNIREAILVGHSDGASIALIHAGRTGCAGVKALLLEAPHVFTEPSGLASIAKITEVYRTTDLRDRLARHHGTNTDIAFRGWNDVWLDPDFRSWNIEEFLPAITVPVLLIQGNDDEYGTIRQIEAIKRQVKGPVEVLNVPACGHSPHREHPGLALDAMTSFVQRHLAICQ
ncbi:MAG: alpha/beta hydrolase [Chitinispirillaceae bacterium]|nr:alpha/beta hydrolase [Chitinispirillaceae bacterium]